MQISGISTWMVEVPRKAPIAPYRSHVRTSSTTTKIIVRLDTHEGLYGWGEANINFLSGINRDTLQKQASEWIIGRDPTNITLFHATCPLETRLKAGIELAMWDIAGKASGLPVAELLGGIIREEVELAACMGIQSYERAGEIASFYVEEGYSTLKTKASNLVGFFILFKNLLKSNL